MDKSYGLLTYDIFKPFGEVVAFTTTRETFPGKVTRFTGDSIEDFAENRNYLSSLLDISSKQLVFPRQTHTSCVAEVSEIPTMEIRETDALVTNNKEICLCVQTADCVPILLFDPVNKAIAAIHAGWRGTVSKIADEAVQNMVLKYNTSPENVLAVIGPSISPAAYEVGKEVAGMAKKNVPNGRLTIIEKEKGELFFDLWEANRQILLNAGLKDSNLEIFGECSYKEGHKYYSARREGIDTGRMVSGIMLK